MENENKAEAFGHGPEHAVAEVLTITEAALFLRCSKAHVQNLLAGKVAGAPPLPFIPIGRRKLIRRKSLLAWMERAEGLQQC
jgi:excisionase family DNA binding protein